jgi:hypothetical protein
MTEEKAPWGSLPPSNPNAVWVKIRDLVGVNFTLLNVKKGVVSERPSFIFETKEGQLFSANDDGVGTISQQIERHGLPPLNGVYTITSTPSTKNKQGYTLSLTPVVA